MGKNTGVAGRAKVERVEMEREGGEGPEHVHRGRAKKALGEVDAESGTRNVAETVVAKGSGKKLLAQRTAGLAKEGKPAKLPTDAAVRGRLAEGKVLSDAELPGMQAFVASLGQRVEKLKAAGAKDAGDLAKLQALHQLAGRLVEVSLAQGEPVRPLDAILAAGRAEGLSAKLYGPESDQVQFAFAMLRAKNFQEIDLLAKHLLERAVASQSYQKPEDRLRSAYSTTRHWVEYYGPNEKLLDSVWYAALQRHYEAASAPAERGARRGDAEVETWLASLEKEEAPFIRELAERLLAAMSDNAPPFAAGPYKERLRLVGNGIPPELAAKLTPEAVTVLAARIGVLHRAGYGLSAAEPPAGGRLSETQRAWKEVREALGDPATIEAVARALRPPISKAEWRTLIERMRTLPHGREFLADHRRAAFARSAYFELKAQLDATPRESWPTEASLRDWYVARWEQAVARFNAGPGARTGIRLDGPPPGLEGNRPHGPLTLLQALRGSVFGVYSAVPNSSWSERGYAVTSGIRSPAGTADINLVATSRGGRLDGLDALDSKVSVLFHEWDHLRRGYDYRRAESAADAAHNLLGETLAPLHELAALRPDLLELLLERPELLRKQIDTIYRDYAEDSRYFPPNLRGAAVELVTERLLSIAKEGPSAPVENLQAVLFAPESFGMLSGSWNRDGARPIDATIDLRRQETLRRVSLSDAHIREGVLARGWDARTADQLAELLRATHLEPTVAAELSAREIDLMHQVAVQGSRTPATSPGGLSGSASLTAERVLAIVDGGLLGNLRRSSSPYLSPERLRRLEPAQILAIGKYPTLLELSAEEQLALDPARAAELAAQRR